MIHKVVQHLHGMAVCMAAIILLCLPEAVICNGLSVGRALIAAVVCIVIMATNTEKSPCLLEQDTSAQEINLPKVYRTSIKKARW